jgi:hypothetical protein
MTRRRAVLFGFFLLAGFGAFCQDAFLPRGYGAVTLGMGRDEVEAALRNNPAFGYRGERDVSLLPEPNQFLIETPGGVNSFFARSFFQFYDNKLYIIIINLNPEKSDHSSVFSSLYSKYGAPLLISPEKSEWRDNEVILSLEKPLTLKYVDAAVFAGLAEQAGAEETVQEQSRGEFLEGL